MHTRTHIHTRMIRAHTRTRKHARTHARTHHTRTRAHTVRSRARAHTHTCARRKRERSKFLARHLETLKPFITAKLINVLESVVLESPRKTRAAAVGSPRKTRGSAAATAAADSVSGANASASTAVDIVGEAVSPDEAGNGDDEGDDGEDVEITEPGCKISDTQLQDLLHECELRDYQCDGIRFLIEMYDRGIPAILGDEVRCV